MGSAGGPPENPDPPVVGVPEPGPPMGAGPSAGRKGPGPESASAHGNLRVTRGGAYPARVTWSPMDKRGPGHIAYR